MIEIIVVLVCLILNATLAAAEMAFVSAGRAQIKLMAGKGLTNAKTLLNLRQNPERILSIIQIGITLVGAIAAAVSGAGAEEWLGPTYMSYFKVSEETAEALAIATIVLPLTYINVVFGELIPKSISLKNPLAIAMFAAPWLALFDRLLWPLVSLLENSTKFFLGLWGRTPAPAEAREGEDFVEIGQLQKKTKEYVINMIHAEKKRARDTMIPWESVNFIKKSFSMEEVEEVVLRSGHTRLPVKDDDHIVGLLHTKEFMNLVKAGRTDWQEYIRPILRFRAMEPILDILPKMQESRSHMAAVYDRLTPIGILTIEDIVEEVVGDLRDEDDDGRVARLMARKKR
ncbi:MAG: HlyC/CorC family transporter [Bdellovibrionaceae bacterium]|nr:HlyC/CorC family transporter [Pseudobdellovibrionaceae bacterium]